MVQLSDAYNNEYVRTKLRGVIVPIKVGIGRYKTDAELTMSGLLVETDFDSTYPTWLYTMRCQQILTTWNIQ